MIRPRMAKKAAKRAAPRVPEMELDRAWVASAVGYQVRLGTLHTLGILLGGLQLKEDTLLRERVRACAFTVLDSMFPGPG